MNRSLPDELVSATLAANAASSAVDQEERAPTEAETANHFYFGFSNFCLLA